MADALKLEEYVIQTRYGVETKLVRPVIPPTTIFRSQKTVLEHAKGDIFLWKIPRGRQQANWRSGRDYKLFQYFRCVEGRNNVACVTHLSCHPNLTVRVLSS